MSFNSKILQYDAYTYSTNREPITLKQQSLKLVQKSNGYGVEPQKILIKVHAASLNPIDIILYNSAYPALKWWFGEQGIGRDYSGVIADIGDTAAAQTGYKVGDEVVGLYSHAFGKGTVSEYIEIDPNVDKAIVKKPQSLSFNEAASFPLVYGTAHLMINNHDLKGKKILVFGGSTSVGKYIIQLARIRGAKIIVTTNSPRSNDLVTRLGSTHQIDYTKNKNLLNPVLESVKESGEFDYIYDTCGNSDLFPQVSKILKPRSANSTYVTCVGDAKLDYGKAHIMQSFFDNFKALFRNLKGKLGLGINYKLALLETGKEWMEDAKKEFDEGQLELFIDSVHKWDNFTDALDRVRFNKANGKVVIETNA